MYSNIKNHLSLKTLRALPFVSSALYSISIICMSYIIMHYYLHKRNNMYAILFAYILLLSFRHISNVILFYIYVCFIYIKYIMYICNYV